jgi:hypothetical protein
MKELEIAITQLGKCEQPKGSNWGETVKTYLKAGGITFPAPWCMCFVQWCFAEAGNPLPYKGGGVLDVYHHMSMFKSLDPKPGDIMIMQFAHGTGHTGIVEAVGPTTVTCIEGNTNDDGSREGYEVARRIRNKSSILAYIHFENKTN